MANEIGNITAQEKVELSPGNAPRTMPKTSPPNETAKLKGVKAASMKFKKSNI